MWQEGSMLRERPVTNSSSMILEERESRYRSWLMQGKRLFICESLLLCSLLIELHTYVHIHVMVCTCNDQCLCVVYMLVLLLTVEIQSKTLRRLTID